MVKKQWHQVGPTPCLLLCDGRTSCSEPFQFWAWAPLSRMLFWLELIIWVVGIHINSHRKSVWIVGFNCHLQPLPPSSSPAWCEGHCALTGLHGGQFVLRVCYSWRLLEPLWRSHHHCPTLQGRNGDLLPMVSSWEVVVLRASLEPGFSAVHLWRGQMWMTAQPVPVPLNTHPPSYCLILIIVALWCVVQFRAHSQWWAGAPAA